jgi:hypothetical protein
LRCWAGPSFLLAVDRLTSATRGCHETPIQSGVWQESERMTEERDWMQGKYDSHAVQWENDDNILLLISRIQELKHVKTPHAIVAPDHPLVVFITLRVIPSFEPSRF